MQTDNPEHDISFSQKVAKEAKNFSRKEAH